MEGRSGSRDLRLAPSRHAPCIIGYDKTYFTELKAQHDARFGNESSRERDRDITALFSGVVPLTIDDAGRIVLPTPLKRIRKIGAHVWFVGGGDFFEMWDPWVYLAREDVDPFNVELLRLELEGRSLSESGPPLPVAK